MNKFSHNEEVNEAFVIEGIITELQVSLSTENLFKQIDQHYRAKSVITGLGAVVGDLYGQAASAASVAMYEGEYTENFICMIGDQVMCGTFGGASKLPVGKKVKAVVHKQGDVLAAAGILCESEGLVWLGHAWGSQAERMANFKIAWWCFFLAIFGATLMLYFSDGNPAESKLESFLWGVIPLGCLFFGMAFWNSSTMNAFSDPATEVFRMLGFAEPECVNLNSYQYGIVYGQEVWDANETRTNYGNIHCYKKAIEDGKIKMLS